jgi:hydroxymethylpyrimidine pyrophosphatase-like HAD family hydrolase
MRQRRREISPWDHERVLKRARDHVERLVESLNVTTVYADLDGTLLGPGGSLFAGPGQGSVTGEPAAVLAALAGAGIDLVLMSGRTHDQVREAARTLGARVFIAEIGGVIVYRERSGEELVRGEAAGRRGSAYRAIERSGAAGYLLEAYDGRLEPHAPWAFLSRQSSMLLRGQVGLDEARTLLREGGYGWLDLQDNGVIPNARARFPWLNVDQAHAYHLVPRGVSKRSAVALDRSRRDLGRSRCVAVGDGPSDAEVASEVGAVFIVSNGVESLGGMRLADNVFVTDRSHGSGFVEAVAPFVHRAGAADPR